MRRNCATLQRAGNQTRASYYGSGLAHAGGSGHEKQRDSSGVRDADARTVLVPPPLFLQSREDMPERASRRRGPSKNSTAPALSYVTTTGSNLPMSISRRSRYGDQRPSCSGSG